MMFIILSVFAFLVFSANCRNLSDGPDISDDGRYLSDGRDLPDGLDQSNGYDHSNGPDDEASTIVSVLFSDGNDGLAFSTEDADMDISIVGVGLGAVQAGFDYNNSYFLDHQLEEDGGVQSELKLRGGSKCKSAIVCSLLGGSCVTSSTYCSGREVPSVCNGAKCKCCIPVNLEVKIHDLEQELRSMVVNLTVASSNLHAEMETISNSIMANLSNANSMTDLKIESLTSDFTNTSSNLKNELQVIKENMSNASANQDSKLDSISDQQGTIKTQFDNFKKKLESLEANMQNISSELNSEFESSKDNMNSITSSINKELQSLKNNTATNLQSLKSNMENSFLNVNSKLGCPKGLFLFTPSNQCFRILSDKTRTFDEAKSACSALGLQLAHPYEPVALRNFLLTKYGLTSYTWLNGRGSGSGIKWQGTGQTISSDNPLWWPGRPGSDVSTYWCLNLMTTENGWKRCPNQPYYSQPCHGSYWVLCELVRE